MKLVCMCLWLWLCTLPLQAENMPDYSQIDQKTLAIPESLTKTTGGIASYINQNFEGSTAKTRAIFIWIASNISYDIERTYNVNFYEKREDKISKALKTRRGICSNYAALFDDLCEKTGIRCYVLEGYTQQKGFTDYLPHAWCVAEVDGNWYMFDPTWGSGYVDHGKFYTKINNRFFKVTPIEMIKDHMPFDYMWQFLYHPVTNQEFYDGKTEEAARGPYFNFMDSIAAYEKLSAKQQLIASYRRIEKNGVKNALIADRLRHLKEQIEINKENLAIVAYNAAAEASNEGINLYNLFIEYRNKQFIPMKSDADIRKMLDLSESKFMEAKARLRMINDPSENLNKKIVSLNKFIDGSLVQVNEQKEWLQKYFSKDVKGRKAMFYK